MTMISADNKTPVLVATTSLVAAASLAWWMKRRNNKDTRKPAPLQVEIACNCGDVRFRISSTHALPLLCYCDDCQGYVKWVTDKNETNDNSKENKKAATLMDDDGGCHVCQVFKSEITEAKEGSTDKLQWTVLDPKIAPHHPQIMFRGHATCCNTPMFSACWRNFPSVGFFVGNIVEEESIMPEPIYIVNTQWAKNQDIQQQGHKSFPPAMMLRFMMRNFVLYRSYMTPCAWKLPDDPKVRYEQRPVIT